jgi:hypothetical protein
VPEEAGFEIVCPNCHPILLQQPEVAKPRRQAATKAASNLWQV